MKKIILSMILFSSIVCNAQTELNNYIGIDIFQLPSTTLNANYTIEYKPYLTPLIEAGYTINYVIGDNYDYMSYFLVDRIDCGCDGKVLEKQTGGDIKIGAIFNFRRDFEKQHFFHVGLFGTNSIIYEKGTYQSNWLEYDETPNIVPIKHTIYILSSNYIVGYEFRISKKLKSSFDLQYSLSTKNIDKLYTFVNFVPGIGVESYKNYRFPLLLFNLKYQL
jgi:hypothetical protein